MKAQELRQGNKLIHPEITTDKFGKVFTVTAIYKNGFIQGTYQYEDHNYDPATNEVSVHIDKLQGIPLTEEILLKAGFENDDEFYSKNTVGFSEFALTRKEGYEKLDEFELINIHSLIGTGCSIKYLHELQNLFYDLKHEELEVKL